MCSTTTMIKNMAKDITVQPTIATRQITIALATPMGQQALFSTDAFGLTMGRVYAKLFAGKHNLLGGI